MKITQTKSSFLLALPLLLSSFSAFADRLDAWSYFNGASRTVKNTGDWIQLDASNKAYCNGRVRLSQNDDFSYTLDIEGSWCKVAKFGFQVDGTNFSQTDSTQRFDLSKTDASDGGWSGYGGSFTIPMGAIFAMGDGASQLSLVLYTDSRDDTRRQAYEKLTIEVATGRTAPSSATDASACIDEARRFASSKLGVSANSLSVDNIHVSRRQNFVYDVHSFFSTLKVTTDQSCQVVSSARE